MQNTDNKKPIMLHGLYVLPSLFTAGNLLLGMMSIIHSMHNEYTPAAWLIFAAMGCDIMDGRIARWAKATSSFGVEFDSLADLVSFGLAPAILMYQMVLHTMNRPGLAIALFFVLAGALRLARFNVKTHEGESSGNFVGLPIPAAAGMLASFVLSYELFEGSTAEITVKTIPIIMKRMPFFFKTLPIFMLLISFLMVSNVPYLAVKKFKMNRPKSVQLFALISVAILLVLVFPQNTIFILFLGYLVSGLAGYIWRYVRLRRALRKAVRLQREAGHPCAADKHE